MRFIWILWLSIFLLSTYVLFEQVTDRYWAGFALEVDRHQDMLTGQAKFYNPWQYRMLAPWLLEGLIQWMALIPADLAIESPYFQQFGIDFSQHLPFLLLRWMQNLLIFFLMFHYLGQCGIANRYLRLLGLLLLSYAMYPANFSADLSFNTYFDIIFYLGGALLILNRKWVALPLLMIPAALNRETILLLPWLLWLYATAHPLPLPWNLRPLSDSARKALPIAAGMLAAFLLISAGLRYYYGYPDARTVYGNKYPWEYAYWNLSQWSTYTQWLRSFTLIPWLGLLLWKHWPDWLKNWARWMLPVWLVVHLGHGIIRETRLFLVPMALILIPGLLTGILGSMEEEKTSTPALSEKKPLSSGL